MSAATSSKVVGASRCTSAAHRPALELEHADGVALAEQLERLRVVERDVVDVGPCAGARSTRSRVISMTSRLRRPRKSILRSPRSSTPCISYWVTIGASSIEPPGSGLRWIGRYSVSGSRVMTTAAAWMPSWRRSPSRPLATSITCLRVGIDLRRARAARSPSCSRRRASAPRRGTRRAACRGP